VVGSNVFNILACLGAAAAVSDGGIPVSAAVRNFDLWVMLAVALGCLTIAVPGRTIQRWEGGVFLAFYVAYVAYLVLAAQRHEHLPAFSGAMLGYVLPLTVIALVIGLVRANSVPPPC